MLRRNGYTVSGFFFSLQCLWEFICDVFIYRLWSCPVSCVSFYFTLYACSPAIFHLALFCRIFSFLSGTLSLYFSLTLFLSFYGSLVLLLRLSEACPRLEWQLLRIVFLFLFFCFLSLTTTNPACSERFETWHRWKDRFPPNDTKARTNMGLMGLTISHLETRTKRV